MPIRILLADDHQLFRSGVRLACETLGGFEIVAEASNGAEAIELTARFKPDIILMDIQMPDMDGVKAIAAITGANLSTQVIILTMYRHGFYVTEAIKVGARGYLFKDCSGESMVEAVRTVVHGGVVMPPELPDMLLKDCRFMSEKGKKTFPDDHLTAAEMDVLLRVAQGDNNQQIASFLAISVKTVANRLNCIYDKLQVKNRTQAALTAVRKGWAEA